jgi:hypothetical protein
LRDAQGFSAADVRSICDLGASTKVGDVGSIGHKGIGFKSVFAVSDPPRDPDPQKLLLGPKKYVHHGDYLYKLFLGPR